MENAHLRLGALKFERVTEKASTSIRVKLDHYIGLDSKAHLISVFGNDSDIGAIAAAVHEFLSFQVLFPDGSRRYVSLGEKATCFRSSVVLRQRKPPVRHLVAISQELKHNGNDGLLFVLDWARKDLVWTTMASLLGVPGDSTWSEAMVFALERTTRVEKLDAIGFDARAIRITSEELLEWIGQGVKTKRLPFPEKNGPVEWPRYAISDLLLTQQFLGRCVWT